MADPEKFGEEVQSRPLVKTFSEYCRQKYGTAVGKIPVDLGILCVNRGHGGCIFCRPSSFTPGYLKAEDEIEEQIRKGKEQFLFGRFKRYYAYFQQETPTATDHVRLLSLAEKMLADDDCLGLIFSTRPDCLKDVMLVKMAGLVSSSEKDCHFELGLQSIHEASLKLLNRNHSYQDFRVAHGQLKEHGCFGVGAHLIMGIPGESRAQMLETVTAVCALGIDSLKLHHLQVIEGTRLESMYRQGLVDPFDVEQYLEFLLEILPKIPARVTIHRLWSASHPSILVAPRWGLAPGVLSDRLRRMMVGRKLWQGKYA